MIIATSFGLAAAVVGAFGVYLLFFSKHPLNALDALIDFIGYTMILALSVAALGMVIAATWLAWGAL